MEVWNHRPVSPVDLSAPSNRKADTTFLYCRLPELVKPKILCRQINDENDPYKSEQQTISRKEIYKDDGPDQADSGWYKSKKGLAQPGIEPAKDRLHLTNSLFSRFRIGSSLVEPEFFKKIILDISGSIR